MGLIEAILLGIQFKRLEKPLVFFSMLTGLVLFSIIGAGIIGVLIAEFSSMEREFSFQLAAASLALLMISAFFFGLAWVCAYFIKRCFE